MSNEFFDFCVAYRNAHESIAAPEEFRISDKEFEDFKAFMEKSEFVYDNRAKKALDIVRSLAVQEGYADDAKAELDALEAKLSRNLAEDLQRWQAEVRKSLETAIIGAYYHERGMVAYGLKSDPDVDEAVRLFNHPEEYRRILGNGGGSAAK